MDRQAILDHYRRSPDVSVLIVGAGVNGIGTFRDLALQGVDVLMIDRGDFCSGASAASSHMLHGGLRYLENGEFRLVREALVERNRMLRNAPHQSRPLPTTIPIFKWFSGFLNAPLKFLGLLNKPSERGAVVIKLGLMLYDAFAAPLRVMPTHHFDSRKKSLEQRPQLNPEVIATATYYDAWMPSPERICVEMVLDAEAANPRAHAVNYLSLAGGADDTVRLIDEETGESLDVRPKVVVNAAGPWIDFANAAMNQPSEFIGGTKGSHLVVDHLELHAATRGHQMFFENQDGRIVLFHPIHDKVMLGTSDIRINHPDEARVSDEEVDYFLGMVRKVFPNIDLRQEHVVYRFVGVRPLPKADANTPGQISRDHSLRVIEPSTELKFPVLNLIGGKWTTFRAFSEQTADAVLERLGQPRKVSTADLPIGGGADYPSKEQVSGWVEKLSAQYGIPAAQAQMLFERYGTLAGRVADYIAAGEDRPLKQGGGFTYREIMYLATHEKAVHLEDVLQRRTLIAMLGEATPALVREVADAMGQALGWSEVDKQAEMARAAAILKDLHGIDLEITPDTVEFKALKRRS